MPDIQRPYGAPEGQPLPEAPEVHLPESGMPKRTAADDIIEGYDSGLYSEAEAEDKIADYEATQKSLFDMDPADVENLYRRGVIDDQAADTYLDRLENPAMYWTKEIASIPIKGIERAIEDTASFTADIWNFINPFDALDVNPNAEIPDYIKPQTSMVGDIGAEMTSFLVPFTGASKAIKTAGYVNKIMQSEKMLALAAKFPKTAGLLEFTMEGTMAGGVADAINFNLEEGKLVDFAKEHNALPQVLDFLTTDPDNPMVVERLKAVLEGAVLGVGIDTVIKSFKAVRASLIKQAHGDLDKVAGKLTGSKVAPEMNKAIEARVERSVQDAGPQFDIDALKARRDELAQKTGKTPNEKAVLESMEKRIATMEKEVKLNADPAADPIKPPKKQFGDIKDAKSKAAKVVTSVLKGEPAEHSDEFLKIIEEGSDPHAVFDQIFNTFKKDIDKARGGPLKKQTNKNGSTWEARVPHRETERKASNIIKKVEADDPKAVIKFFREKLGGFGDMVEVARGFERYFRKYSGDVNRIIAEAKARPSLEAKIRAAHHISYMGEMMSMIHGVRSTSGRLLNSFQMSLGVKDFDYKNIPDLTYQAVKENESQLDDIIEAFSTETSLANQLKVAKRFGKQPFARNVLAWSQAAKLWSWRTHATNITSQTGMLTLHTINRMVGITFNALSKGDLKLFKEAQYTMEGYWEAMRNMFREPKTMKKIMKGMASGEYKTMRQALLENPELGNVWKAVLSGEGQIDKATKIADQATLQDMGTMVNSWKKATVMRAWQLPFTGLVGPDEVFKNLGYFSEMNGLAFREGYESGLRGTELTNYIDDAMKGNNSGLHEQATLKSRELVFQNPLDKCSDGIRDWIDNKMPGGLYFRAAFMPYFNVPVNIAKTAIKYTPFAALNETYRKAFYSAHRVKKVEMAMAMAEGSILMAYVAQKYKKGEVIGMIPPTEYNAHKNKGIQEYSDWDAETGQWISQERRAPASMIQGLTCDIYKVAEMVEQARDPNMDVTAFDVVRAGLQGIAQIFVEGTWARSAKDVFQAVMMPSWDRTKKMGRNVVKGMVPGQNVIADSHKKFREDKTVRQVTDMLDLVQSFIDPTKLLPQRHPVWGTTMETVPRAPGFETLGQIGMHRATQEREDMVLQEFLDLSINVRPLEQDISWLKENREATPQERNDVMEILSKLPVREVLESVIESPGYQSIGDYRTKKEILSGIYSQFRTAAKDLWRAGNSEVTEQYLNKVLYRVDAIAGNHIDDNPISALYRYSHRNKDKE